MISVQTATLPYLAGRHDAISREGIKDGSGGSQDGLVLFFIVPFDKLASPPSLLPPPQGPGLRSCAALSRGLSSFL